MSTQADNHCISSVYGRCVEVLDEHLDAWNHTNNVCYVHWMQEVAVEHSAVLGWDSDRYLKSGAMWVVRSHKVDYRRSSYKGDKILVQTWIAEMKKVSCIRRYRFLELPRECDVDLVNESCRFSSYERFEYPKDSLIATAETLWAFVSSQNFRPIRVFPELFDIFEQKPNTEAFFPS